MGQSSSSMSLWRMRNYLNWSKTGSTDLLRLLAMKDSGYLWVYVFSSEYILHFVSLNVSWKSIFFLVSGPIRNHHHLCSLWVCQFQLTGHCDWRSLWVLNHIIVTFVPWSRMWSLSNGFSNTVCFLFSKHLYAH